MKRFALPLVKLSFLFLLIGLATACEKDDPDIPDEEELITTVTYTLTPSDGGSTVVMRFSDLDGDGGTPASISDITLNPNTTYQGEMSLLNELENPVEIVTEEIEEEQEEHQLFFDVDVPGVAIAYNDMDADGNPVGLSTTLTTGSAASGTITMTLRHEPNKDAAGVAEGDISNAGGETDIEITFNVEVQ